MRKSVSCLYLVGLPIGNPLDITERATKVLQEADMIAAEDTRVFKLFCQKANITPRGKIISYFDARETEKAAHLIQCLKDNLSVAVVSDAGTPNIFDPGFRLLTLAHQEDIKVVPIPGPSSVTTALSVCPLPGLAFVFYGFPPSQSNARKKLFSSVDFEGRVVFFESPHRIKEHISDAIEIWGEETMLFIARELTKPHEELGLNTLKNWRLEFEGRTPKGEFVLIYASPKKEVFFNLDQWLKEQIQMGRPAKEILKDSQTRTNMNRRQIYDLILQYKRELK